MVKCCYLIVKDVIYVTIASVVFWEEKGCN